MNVVNVATIIEETLKFKPTLSLFIQELKNKTSDAIFVITFLLGRRD